MEKGRGLLQFISASPWGDNFCLIIMLPSQNALLLTARTLHSFSCQVWRMMGTFSKRATEASFCLCVANKMHERRGEASCIFNGTKKLFPINICVVHQLEFLFFFSIEDIWLLNPERNERKPQTTNKNEKRRQELQQMKWKKNEEEEANSSKSWI